MVGHQAHHPISLFSSTLVNFTLISLQLLRNKLFGFVLDLTCKKWCLLLLAQFDFPSSELFDSEAFSEKIVRTDCWNLFWIIKISLTAVRFECVLAAHRVRFWLSPPYFTLSPFLVWKVYYRWTGNEICISDLFLIKIQLERKHNSIGKFWAE